MRIVVTGAHGLLGWHAAARLHAAVCGARFRGTPPVWEPVLLDHAKFDDDAALDEALAGADAVLHFAGVNRGPAEAVEAANPAIAHRLAHACARVGVQPHIVNANSVHAGTNTPYGRSKAGAAAVLAGIGGPFTDLMLPHIFGEGARPRYNNVTATFIEALVAGHTPQIDPMGQVSLLHAGAAAQVAIDVVRAGTTGVLTPQARPMAVTELWSRLVALHDSYERGLFPVLDDPFDLALFNTYRVALYPQGFPRPLGLHSDHRGDLFEVAKGFGGQVFASWTVPGRLRGNHFHLRKVERFVVVQGEAIIRIRRVLGGPVWEFPVSGTTPAAVDMPTLHTHSIENVGPGPLLTLFWTHELFDPDDPDTFADPVQEGRA